MSLTKINDLISENERQLRVHARKKLELHIIKKISKYLSEALTRRKDYSDEVTIYLVHNNKIITRRGTYLVSGKNVWSKNRFRDFLVDFLVEHTKRFRVEQVVTGLLLETDEKKFYFDIYKKRIMSARNYEDLPTNFKRID